jgi:hypothetical protein
VILYTHTTYSTERSVKRFLDNLRSHVLKALNAIASEPFHLAGYFTCRVRILKQDNIAIRQSSYSQGMRPICLLPSAVSGSFDDKLEERTSGWKAFDIRTLRQGGERGACRLTASENVNKSMKDLMGNPYRNRLFGIPRNTCGK